MTDTPDAHHLDLLHRVRTWLNSDGPTREAMSAEFPVRVMQRTESSAEDLVAFLATFTEAEGTTCYLLEEGLDRVGRDPSLGDYPKPAERLTEPRQWLIVCRGGSAIVADDRTTNGSVVLPAGLALPGEVDPRAGSQTYSYSAFHPRPTPGRIDLDWHGRTTHALADGDVLLTMYAGFVFGWLRADDTSRGLE